MTAVADNGDNDRWHDYVSPRSLSGYLMKRSRRACQLLRCPACGRDFTDGWRTRNNPLSKHLLEEHEPEDFGLTRERP